MKKDETNQINLAHLLKLEGFSEEQQELGLREFRIRGIDTVITDLKKLLDTEGKTALNNQLKMCPSIECLVAHLQNEHKELDSVLESYLPKLHKKL